MVSVMIGKKVSFNINYPEFFTFNLMKKIKNSFFEFFKKKKS